jgi:protein-disulfide isomerase
MNKWIISISALLLLLLPACSGIAESASVPSPEPAPTTEIVFVTASPTPPPTHTPLPTPTSTQVVAALATDTPTPEPSLVPTNTPLPEPPAIPTPEPDWLNTVGRTEDDLVYLGNPDAPVTLIDYSDFMWLSCRTYVLGAEPAIRENYIKTGQVRLIFSPVLNHGDRSYQSHQAVECAAEQGQFWEFHDVLFENQGALWAGDIQATVKQLAAEAGLDTDSFNACMDEQRYLDLIFSQDEVRRQRGIRGQPVFDINGQFLIGAQPFDVFQSVIESQLGQ